MRTSSTFGATAAEIDELVRRHPLALVVSSSADGLVATPLPLLLERDGENVTLLGHFARANPHLEAVRSYPDALVAFMGPQGYISPSWFTDRSQAPTWNFATLHFNVRIRLNDDPQAARLAVERLTGAMEVHRPRAWQPHELGERYTRLLAHIVPFQAEVLRTQVKFKLGQNERLDVLAEALQGVRGDGSGALADLMKRANAHRL